MRIFFQPIHKTIFKWCSLMHSLTNLSFQKVSEWAQVATRSRRLNLDLYNFILDAIKIFPHKMFLQLCWSYMHFPSHSSDRHKKIVIFEINFENEFLSVCILVTLTSSMNILCWCGWVLGMKTVSISIILKSHKYCPFLWH